MVRSAVGWEGAALLQEMSSSEAQIMLTEMIKSFDMGRTIQKRQRKIKVVFVLMKPGPLVRERRGMLRFPS